MQNGTFGRCGKRLFMCRGRVAYTWQDNNAGGFDPFTMSATLNHIFFKSLSFSSYPINAVPVSRVYRRHCRLPAVAGIESAGEGPKSDYLSRPPQPTSLHTLFIHRRQFKKLYGRRKRSCGIQGQRVKNIKGKLLFLDLSKLQGG